jgi:hypothetical protein
LSNEFNDQECGPNYFGNWLVVSRDARWSNWLSGNHAQVTPRRSAAAASTSALFHQTDE